MLHTNFQLTSTKRGGRSDYFSIVCSVTFFLLIRKGYRKFFQIDFENYRFKKLGNWNSATFSHGKIELLRQVTRLKLPMSCGTTEDKSCSQSSPFYNFLLQSLFIIIMPAWDDFTQLEAGPGLAFPFNYWARTFSIFRSAPPMIFYIHPFHN